MAESKIVCPKCSHTFALTETVEKSVRAELSAEFDERAEALKIDFDKRQSALQKALNEKAEELAAESKRETAKLTAEKLGIEKEITKRLEAAKKSLETAARSEASAELESVQQELNNTAQKLKDAQAKELELRGQRRALEEARAEFELASARKLDEERDKIRSEVEGRIGEAHQLKSLEWTKKQADMEKLIDELRRKSEQGSQQAQGEVLELSIQETLRSTFTHDSIEPVAKGVTGGDVLQRVMTKTGQSAGAILYEIKRTKNWSDAWVQKLKDNQRSAKAELAVIITTAVPEGITRIGIVEGVWVVDVQSFPGLTLALRSSLIELHHARGAAVGKNEKMETLYSYLSGPEFRGRVEGIMEAFSTMRDDLDAEKRAIEKSWAKREKSLARVLSNTAGMHGDLAGIIGASLQEVPALTLEIKD